MASLPRTNVADQPGLAYPCYKSFDEFIDVEGLRSLDGYLTEKIQKQIASGCNDLFLNEHRLDPMAPHQPGAREVWLTTTKPGTPYNYLDLNKPELWEKTQSAKEFSRLMDFICTLPFVRTGRVLIIYDDQGLEVPAHRDHLETAICHEFIWFRTNLKKPFYMYNQYSHQKLYVRSYSAWFDTVNQFHGSDAFPGLSFSVRVDGIFNRNLKKRLPRPLTNLAATPALWANSDTRIQR